MFEVQFNRHYGADESFEADTLAEAMSIVAEFGGGSYLTQVLDPSGRVVWAS